MMWLPRSDAPRSGSTSVDRAHCRRSPEHASLYLLELYPNAPLRQDMARAGWSQAPDDDAAEMYEDAMRACSIGRRLSPIRDLERRACRGASRATTSSTGRTASGWRSGAARTARAAASGGGTWPATAEYMARVAGTGPGSVPRRGPQPNGPGRGGADHGAAAGGGVDVEAVGRALRRGRRAAVGRRAGPPCRGGDAASWRGRGCGSRGQGMLLANEVLSVFV